MCSKPNKQVHVWVFPNPEWVCRLLAHAASGQAGLLLKSGCLGWGSGPDMALCLPVPQSLLCQGRGTETVVSLWQAALPGALLVQREN